MRIEIDQSYNIDCMDGMRLMADQGMKADMLLTDIPYNEVNRNGKIRNFDKGKADVLTFDLIRFLKLADSVVTGTFIIFCGIEQVSAIRGFFAKNGYTTRLLVWEKSNPSPINGEKVYLSGIECAVWAKKSKATFNAFCKNTVFRFPSGANEIHPTQKPLELWYDLLRDNTDENQIVLDTCAGSFTTAIACHRMQRHYVLFEKEKNYFDLGEERRRRELAQVSFFENTGGVL